jgi:dienelactone hydrolase
MATGFRQMLVRLLGRMPARSALQPKILERIPLQGLVREKVSYQVEPGQRVSAFLFLPEAASRRPAVLCIHQHKREFHLGKSEPAGLSGNPEQYYALELAKRGYVTLAPDLICFEERQHPTLRGMDYERFEATRRLTEGSCLQAKMLWDLQRALDFLGTRREVDPRRLGCLGHSLGGQEVLFLTAIDRRIAAGVSSCGFSSYHAIFDAALLHNFAAYVPGILRYGGLERVLGLVAPRPFLALAAAEDPLFPISGVQETVKSARRSYGSRGRDRLRLEVFPGGHGFSGPMREAAYAWFDRWLKPKRR